MTSMDFSVKERVGERLKIHEMGDVHGESMRSNYSRGGRSYPQRAAVFAGLWGNL